MRYSAQSRFLLLNLIFVSSLAAAAKPVVTFSLGADSVHVGNSSTNITFIPPFYTTYAGSNSTDTTVFGGLFLGAEFNPCPHWLSQLGVSYYQNSASQTRGSLYQFGMPMFNSVGYRYGVSAQRVLAETKLLYTVRHVFHPYVDVGIGESFNDAADYLEWAQTSDGVPTAQPFANHSTSNFTYMAGLGFDVDVSQHVRLGLGYRYADFGKASLGLSPIQVSTNTLSNNKLTSNEVLFQLTAIC